MKKALWVLAVVVAGLGAYAANVLATPSVGQSTTTLGKALAADPVDLSGHAKQPGEVGVRVCTRTGSPTST